MKRHFARTTLGFIGCLFLGNSLALAQTRTWVSGVGDDANPCSRSAPCITYAGAISKTAAGGEISVLDGGGFGSVTITKALTINGIGQVASLVPGAGVNAIVINIANPQLTDVVTLHNIQIQCGNTGNIGVHVISATAVVLEDVKIWGCATAVQTDAGKTTINRGWFTNNRSFAVHSTGSSTLTVENSELNANQVAVQADTGSTIRLSNNGVYDNQTGFACGGGTLSSAGNNRKGGNVGGVVPTCTPTVAITIQ